MSEANDEVACGDTIDHDEVQTGEGVRTCRRCGAEWWDE